MKKGREVPQYLPSVAGVSTFGVMKAHDAPPQARLLRRRRARSLGRSRWITNLVNLVAGAGAKTPRHIARSCGRLVTFRNIAPMPTHPHHTLYREQVGFCRQGRIFLPARVKNHLFANSTKPKNTPTGMLLVKRIYPAGVPFTHPKLPISSVFVRWLSLLRLR